MKRLPFAVVALVLCLACSGVTSPTPVDPGGRPPTGSGDAVLVGAGDIGMCESRGSASTAELIESTPGTVFTAGDNAYPVGSAADFENCYHPTWGRFRDRTRPAPGNHEYDTPGAGPYFSYFGANAGPAGLGYYSFNLAAWHIVSLNSQVGTDPGSAQMAWLLADLAASSGLCTLAYYHHPVFSSGVHGNQAHMLPIWRVLYQNGVDVVVSAHDHDYERFAPQDDLGRFDAQRGIRQFVVGTGGATLRPFAAVRPNSEVRAGVWGVLRLTLRPGSYNWDFLSAAGGSLSDSGTGSCH